MSYCNHPPDTVMHDVTQGDWKGRSVQWCRICGAIRVTVHEGDSSVDPPRYVSPWTVPQDQEQSRLGGR